jgi:hypothetical protein
MTGVLSPQHTRSRRTFVLMSERGSAVTAKLRATNRRARQGSHLPARRAFAWVNSLQGFGSIS